MNSTPFVRQYGILITDGVIYYAKRNTKQTIYTGIQTNGSRDNARGAPECTRSDEKV